MSESVTTGVKVISGQQIVIVIYVGMIVFAGIMGLILGVMIEDLQSVALLGIIPIPPTPIGFAAYGSVTIALVFGGLLFAVRTVSPSE